MPSQKYLAKFKGSPVRSDGLCQAHGFYAPSKLQRILRVLLQKHFLSTIFTLSSKKINSMNQPSNLNDECLEKLAALLNRASHDQAFRERCLQNAQLVLQEAGFTIKADAKFYFVEVLPQDSTIASNECYIPLIPFKSGRLDDTELDRVVGGNTSAGELIVNILMFPLNTMTSIINFLSPDR